MRQKKVETAEFEIDFGELIYVLWRKAWLIVLCAVIAGSAAFAYTAYTTEDKYTSTAKIFILPKGLDGEYTLNTFILGREFINDFEEVVKSNYVTERVVKELNLDMTKEEVAESISVETTDKTSTLLFTVTLDDPYIAQNVANKLTQVAKERIKVIFEVDSLNILDEADLNLEPIGKGLKKKTFIGAVAGAAIPSVIVAAVHLFNNTIVIPEDVENYLDLSVLGVIPYDDGKEEKKHKKKRRIKKN